LRLTFTLLSRFELPRLTLTARFIYSLTNGLCCFSFPTVVSEP
jgi:hypothetical protein